jgi:hypothetical protein
MANLNPNSTDYFHSYEPNTNDLTMAMDYNVAGEPIIRTVSSDASGDSFYGANTSLPLLPILQLNSYEGIKERNTQTYTGGGGSVGENGDILVSCTSTLGSYGVYRSLRFIPYRAGQSCVARILGKFDTPVAGTQQRLGVANQENGYFVGYNGTDFQFLHTYGGRAEQWEIDVNNTASANQTITLTLNGVAHTIAVLSGDTVNTIAQKIALEFDDSVWQAVQVDDKVQLLAGSLGNLTGTFSFASTGNVTGTLTENVSGVAATNSWEDITLPSWLVPTDYTHWQFQYAWQGVRVYALQNSSGTWKLIHSHMPADCTIGQTNLMVTNPSFKTTAVAYNTGGASGVTVHVSSFSGFVEGEEAITSYTHGGGVTQTSMSSLTYWHIMSIQNPYTTENDKINYRSIRFLDLTVAVQANDPVEFYIFYNGQPVAPAVFNFISYPDRLYSADVTKKVFNHTLDTPVIALIAGITGSNSQFDLRPYNLVLPPGAHMSLVAYSTASLQKVTIGGTWSHIG